MLYCDPELLELSMDSVVLFICEKLLSLVSHFSHSELLSSVSFIMQDFNLAFFAVCFVSSVLFEVVEVVVVDSGTAPSIGSKITLEVSRGCIPETPRGISSSVRFPLLSLFVFSRSVNVISPTIFSLVPSLSLKFDSDLFLMSFMVSVVSSGSSGSCASSLNGSCTVMSLGVTFTSVLLLSLVGKLSLAVASGCSVSLGLAGSVLSGSTSPVAPSHSPVMSGSVRLGLTGSVLSGSTSPVAPSNSPMYLSCYPDLRFVHN